MGAHFVYACAPACNITEDRRKVLSAILAGLADDDCPDFVDTIEDWRGRLDKALDALVLSRRDLALLNFHGMDPPMFIAGGMLWGDAEAMDAFNNINNCRALRNQPAAWAKQDARPQGGAAGGAPGGAQSLEDELSPEDLQMLQKILEDIQSQGGAGGAPGGDEDALVEALLGGHSGAGGAAGGTETT